MVSDSCEGGCNFVSEHVVVLLNGQWMESRWPGEEASFQSIVPIHAAGYMGTRLSDKALHCSTRVRVITVIITLTLVYQGWSPTPVVLRIRSRGKVRSLADSEGLATP